jgi:hypothetical protein
VLTRLYNFRNMLRRWHKGATKMPIRRYVEEGVFSSEALSAMGKAFEAAIWTLGPECDEMKREAVARFIIQSARNDGSLDVANLHHRAVATFGDPIVDVLMSERGHDLTPALGAGVTDGRGIAQTPLD